MAWEPVEVGDRDRAGSAFVVDRLNLCIECAHGNGHIRWMGRDARLAPAQDCMDAVEACERRTAGPGYTLVAGFCDVVEVVAARPLQQIAGRRRLVAQLAARAGE